MKLNRPIDYYKKLSEKGEHLKKLLREGIQLTIDSLHKQIMITKLSDKAKKLLESFGDGIQLRISNVLFENPVSISNQKTIETPRSDKDGKTALLNPALTQKRTTLEKIVDEETDKKVNCLIHMVGDAVMRKLEL